MSYESKIAALVIGSVGTAAADTAWQRHHPWREQVNYRLTNLNGRINTELREAELTRGKPTRCIVRTASCVSKSALWPAFITAT